MNIEMNKLDISVKRVSLVGRLDWNGTSQVANTFTILVAAEKTAVLVDMSGVDFIASIGIRILVMEARAVARRGGKMGLLQPRPLVEESLRTAGIDLLIPIYSDADTAYTTLLAKIKPYPKALEAA
ncbi:MAG: STAS domain-containing protein [Anaerolineae bacterium]|nr:STAS domain-containing protein [Anaerolineae bacterium]